MSARPRRTGAAGAALAVALLAVALLGVPLATRAVRGERTERIAPAARVPAATMLVAAPAVRPVGAGARVTDTLRIDVRRSVVGWTGTKFRGRGRHEGTVRLAAGGVALCGERVCGGHFVLDLRSIAVTDMPPHETVARERLVRHLAGPDFFWTERYPTATFRLLALHPDTGAAYRVVGELTLRGVSRALAFPAELSTQADGERRVRARFRIDRQRWGVAYRFDPVRNELVDDEIALALELVFPPARAAPVGA